MFISLLFCSLKTHHLFNQIFGNSDLALSHDLDKQVVTRAITIHPVKKPNHMYRLHYNFLTLAVQLLQDRSANVHRRFQRVKMLVKDNNRTKAYQKANFNGRLRRNSSVHWEFFNLQNLFGLCESPVAWIRGRTQNGLKKFLGGVITEINLENQKLLKLPEEYKKMNLGYMRSHPTLGMQFTVDLETLVKPSVPNAAEMPRYSRHYLHFQQSFAPMLARTVLPDDNSPVVHFIVPLAGRLNTFVRFLNSFEGAFLTQGKPVTLLIVFFSNVSSSERHKKVFDNFRTKHPKVDLKWSEIVGEFSRAQALELGANSFGNDELLFFADVDLDFTTEFYHRCEMNTIPGKRVYFPIMFSQFDPQIAYHQKSMPPEDSRELKKRAGTWRKYSYGPVCVYASDVRAVGGLKTTIRGWGMEDLDFHEKCLKHELDAFRVPELGLVHVYHPQTSCLDSRMNVDQAKMCNDSRLQGLASAESLVEYMLSKGYE